MEHSERADADELPMQPPTGKISAQRDSRRILVVFLVLFFCSVVTIWRIYEWANLGYRAVPFTQQAWETAEPETRGHMVEDLLNQHSLKSRSRTEIVDLLGPPDEDQTDLHRFRYLLGNMGRHPNFPMFLGFSLLIRFDAHDNVFSVSVAD